MVANVASERQQMKSDATYQKRSSSSTAHGSKPVERRMKFVPLKLSIVPHSNKVTDRHQTAATNKCATPAIAPSAVAVEKTVHAERETRRICQRYGGR